MVSLADLRARNVVPVWQEAVAVVQELIQTVKASTGSAELLPDLEHIALIPNGDVVALPGSPEVATPPVRHAAVMLQLLVEGAATPPELEQFITRNVGSPPQYDTVAEFSRNLAFFERPGRRSDVERLVGRAVAAEQLTRADEELKRLKQRANDVVERNDAHATPEQTPTRRKVPMAVVAGVVVLAAIALPAWWWRSRAATASPPSQPPSLAKTDLTPSSANSQASPDPVRAIPAATTNRPPASSSSPSASRTAADQGSTGAPAAAAAVTTGPSAPAPKPAASFLERTASAVKSAVGALVGTPKVVPPPAPAPPQQEPTKMAARRRTAPPASAAKHGNVASPALPAVVKRGPASPLHTTDEPAVALPPAMVERPAEDLAIYTHADASVEPPVMVRPVLPREGPPGVRPEDVGTMEVVVDEQGDVLGVKLITPDNRYQERMLVSAAKMWKFRPAYKDGHPVRYRTRVRLTI
jgi:hypothetical protein